MVHVITCNGPVECFQPSNRARDGADDLSAGPHAQELLLVTVVNIGALASGTSRAPQVACTHRQPPTRALPT